MKRAIIALSILCTGALAINPIKNISFAQNADNNTNKQVVQNVETNKSENLNIEKNKNIEVNKEVVKTEVTKKEISKKEISKKEALKNEEKELVVNKKESTKLQKNEQDTKQPVIEKNEAVVENKKEEKTDKNTVEVIEVLNQEQAKELLKMVNPDMNYVYQGNETTFEALSKKGLSGYVFLPDVDGDMGLFVDKNTAKVYYFHPSGYLELAL